MPDRTSLLVLGLGNPLCGDDGLGAVAVALLERSWQAPAGVRVLDGGTLGLALLPHLEEARAVLLVDAIRAEASPGTLVRLVGAEVVPAVRERLSVHQIGVADLLEGARLRDRFPERLVLIGLVPERMEFGLALSPAVEAGLPGLVERIVLEASRLGHEFTLRPSADAGGATSRSGGDAARLLGL